MSFGRPTREDQRGSAFVEFLLLFPTLFFLFVGAFDMGFYCYALIAVEDAARVAALYTSSQSILAGSSTGACQCVRNEMAKMPNNSQFGSSCSALPLKVTAQLITGPDSNSASKVTVSYRSIQLIPIPGLDGQLTITRAVQMRVRT
jgi:Flp pilus assembly protein TadG